MVLIGPHFTGEKLGSHVTQGHMASHWQNWLGAGHLPPLLAGVIGTLLPVKPLGDSLDQRCGLVTLLSSLSCRLADLSGRPWRLCRGQPVTFINWVHHWPSWSEPTQVGLALDARSPRLRRPEWCRHSAAQLALPEQQVCGCCSHRGLADTAGGQAWTG